MKRNFCFTFGMAFALLMCGGTSVLAQNDPQKGDSSASSPAISEPAPEPGASAVITPPSEDFIQSLEENFKKTIEESKRGRTLTDDADIDNEREAVEQMEMTVTGRQTLDLNSSATYLTLPASIDQAIRQHPSLRQQRENISQAEARYRQVKAGENITFKMANVTTLQPKYFYKGQKVTNPWSDTLKASLGKVLTTFGQLENSIASAYLSIGVERLNVQAQERAMAYKVKQAYFNRLKADADVDVSLLNLGLTKESLIDANNMYKQGVMARYDVIQSELQVVEAVEQLARANKSVESSNADLTELLAMEATGPSARLALEKPAEISVDKSCTLDDLKKLAENRRYEIMALDRSREVLQKTRAAAEADNRPTISLSGDYIFSPGVVGTPDSMIQLNLNINWSAWDGGERKAKLEEIDSQMRALDASRENAVDEIRLAVEKAWLDFKLTDVTMRTAKKRVEAAWIFHDMARQRFLNGLGTSIEVREALSSLNSAREAYVNACYNRDLAFANLEYCVGMDFPDRCLTVTPEMLNPGSGENQLNPDSGESQPNPTGDETQLNPTGGETQLNPTGDETRE